MPEVEERSATAFALVRFHYLRFDFERTCNKIASNAAANIRFRNRRAQKCVLYEFAEPVGKFFFWEGAKKRQVDIHAVGLIERSDEVLPAERSIAVLPPTDESIIARSEVGI